jgi:ADP-ribose pyrophosphatase YjhB (NUDIX family)
VERRLGRALSDRGSASDFREQHLRRGDFLGVFAVIRRGEDVLMVQNRRWIAGRAQLVWDLPGGQVEPGERLGPALRRELREEIGVEVEGEPDFLFVQEGEKVVAGRREYVWRSFFFAVDVGAVEPRAGGEILAVRWMAPAMLATELRAPYHDSFLRWLTAGGAYFGSSWCE